MSSPRLRFGAALLALAAVVSLSVSNRVAPDSPPGSVIRGAARRAASTNSSTPALTERPESGLDLRRATLARLAYSQSWDGPLPPAMAAFRAWTERYRGAPSLAARLALEPEGVALARARAPEMKHLIVSDPARALAVTVPAMVRQTLPAAVLAELETRHAGRGDYALQAALSDPREPRPEPSLRRIVYLDGRTFTARTYGRREPQLTKENASLHGIALDGEFALHESPVRLLEPGEITAAAPESTCAGCAQPLAEPDASGAANLAELELVLAEGKLWRFHADELSGFEARALSAEDQPGPRVASLTLEPSAAAPASDFTAPPARAADAPTPHTIGSKQVLVIRVDFSDFPGEPLSQTSVRNLVDSAVKAQLEDMSYGQTTIVTTVTPQVYRLPRTGAAYATANDRTPLHSDARNLASADYTLSSYDRIVVLFPNIGSTRVTGSQITFGGLANVSGTNVWINGANNFSFGTVVHEFGHTYGLLHANLWRVRDGDPLSAGGNTLEYGDPFDLMGSTATTGVTRDTRHHFSMWGKNRLGWLPDEAVLTATRSGVYRIYRFDSRNASREQPLALRIFRDGVRWYWLGLRQAFTTGTPRIDGAYVIWGHNQRLQTQLLDLTTPGAGGSANGALDASLPIGSTFTDPRYGVAFKVLGRGGEDPSEWLDIEVTVPAAPPNVVTAWGREGATFYDTETGEDLVPAPETNVPMDLTDVKDIVAGDQHALALKNDGTLVAWGNNAAGQLTVPSGLTNIVGLAAGGRVSGVVLGDGTVRLWGDPASGILTPPADLRDVRQLAIGSSTALGIYHALALRADGTIVGWGDNTRGQITTPSTVTRAVAIAASDRLSIALRPDGSVVRWGTTFTGAIPFPTGLSDVVAIASSGNAAHALALKRDGTVVGWGVNNENRATPPAGLTDVVAIATGAAHSLALKRDGTVVAWGNPAAGRTAVPRALPPVKAIAASGAASFALTGPVSGPQILAQPQPQMVAVGGTATFSVELAGADGATYQWRKDGVAITGATARTLTVSQVTAASAGSYDVVITVAGAQQTSTAARLTVGTGTLPPPNAPVARIANLSIRTAAGNGPQTLIVGFVIGGPGTSGAKPLLIRGVGPTLTGFGVENAINDPRIELYDGAQRKLLENDNWPANDAAVFTRLGAFALAPGSRDAALYSANLSPASYSAQVSGAAGTSGIVLAEIYDASDSAALSGTTPRLVNVSARAVSGAGGDVLIAGFVITGPGEKRILIRGIGPTLGAFGVTGVLENPRLALFNSAEVRLQENDDWGGADTMTAAFDSVGAFRLERASRDAALLTTLQPGSYTVQVGGVNNTTGVALVEIYEVP
jgi:hypothetical protein